MTKKKIKQKFSDSQRRSETVLTLLSKCDSNKVLVKRETFRPINRQHTRVERLYEFYKILKPLLKKEYQYNLRHNKRNKMLNLLTNGR